MESLWSESEEGTRDAENICEVSMWNVILNGERGEWRESCESMGTCSRTVPFHFLNRDGFDPVQACPSRPVNPAVNISSWIEMCTMRIMRRNEAAVTVYVTSSCLMWITLTTRLQFLGDMKVPPVVTYDVYAGQLQLLVDRSSSSPITQLFEIYPRSS